MFEKNKKVRGFVTETNKMSKIDINKEYINVFEKFLIPCKYSGICNIDFIIVNDNIKIFEINPRLGGSLMMSLNRKDLVKILTSCIDIQKI